MKTRNPRINSNRFPTLQALSVPGFPWILSGWLVTVAVALSSLAVEPVSVVPAKTNWVVTASDVQAENFRAEFAIDSDYATRWSSPFEDGHWLQIDLGHPATVTGVQLSWEVARANKFRLQYSDNAENWQTCLNINEGHGHVDQFYFPPATGRFWRLLCDKRNSEWGASLWEIELFGMDQKPIVTTSSPSGNISPEVVIDGDQQTIWQSSAEPDQSIVVDLRENIDLSGVCVYWGDSYVGTIVLEVSEDGINWLLLSDQSAISVDKHSLILGQTQSARYLRLNLSRPADSNTPVTIREIELRGPEEAIRRANVCPCLFQSASRKSPVEHELTAQGHDSRVDLKWAPSSDPTLRGHNIYRADSEDGPFELINRSVHPLHIYSDFFGENNRTFYYRVTHVGKDGSESQPSRVVSATSSAMTDEQLLTSIQEAAFRYFWDFADPASGLAREGYYTHPCETCTTGGTGFGLMTIMVGADRGFVSRSQAAERLLKMVRFLEEKADRYHGVWSHWLHCTTGETIPFSGPADNGGDLVETAFLIQGMLTVGQYFDRENPVENELRERITRLWKEVEWDWYLREPGNKRLYWHWSPNHHWKMNHQFVGFNECMITYLLAIASPTHSIPAEYYYEGWVSELQHYADGKQYFGITKPVGRSMSEPLFFTHYSFLGLDPNRFNDRFCNYYENNRNTTLINRAYCIDNPGKHKGYGEGLWGLTASLNPDGYKAHAPGINRDDGTIAPTAAICAIPYTPKESMAAIRHLYHEYGKQIWGPFGFYDAFNLDRDWVSPGNLAIDQGPMVPMIENYRTKLCWKMFMSNPEIELMLEKMQDSTDSSK